LRLFAPMMKRRAFDVPVDFPLKHEVFQNRIGTLLTVVGGGITLFLLFLLSVNAGLIVFTAISKLPDVKALKHWSPSESTRILDRYGNLIDNVQGDEDRAVVPLSDINPFLARAVMAIEDNRFYHHQGIDVRGTLRALVATVSKKDVQGGSTLTQQLAKNLFLSSEQTIGRKLAEALLAMQLEHNYEKNRILEMYLNQVYWGNQAYGAEKAARRYFKKPASELTIAECALLAGLLKGPEMLSPYSNWKGAKERQLLVLQAMERYGYITKDQILQAKNEPIQLDKSRSRSRLYPYYVAHVKAELLREYGEDVVRRGGLRVVTALDPQAQKAAEAALIKAITGLPKSSKVTDGALVSIDVETGEVLALVGGVDFDKNQFNNATQMRRAAGSTFKPIVYLTGFRKGIITPESSITDAPICFGNWCPKNWDGRYMGGMTVRQALTLSRNTTTIRLGMRAGVDEVIKTAKMLGITSDLDSNPTSLLGSSGISPLEMANVYSTFARYGEKLDPTVILEVQDSKGRIQTWNRGRPKKLFNQSEVAMLNDILVDVVERGTGKNARLEGRQVAGKTGTTDKVRDIWFAGFTPDLVNVVWMGNKGYVPLQGVFSSNAAKVWHDYASVFYKTHARPPLEFEAPSGGSASTGGVKRTKQGSILPYSTSPEERRQAELKRQAEEAERQRRAEEEAANQPAIIPVPSTTPPSEGRPSRPRNNSATSSPSSQPIRPAPSDPTAPAPSAAPSPG
jgi:penicillin-binding protein 1A